ncbi:hypothetical protein Ancab_032693 [Ancistrocladus abbreviatus]
MLEPELCASRIMSPFREESGDEELSVLPRHTKVIVTGNNRTKSVLVGLQGVVKKAVGLGGWHWLVLKNGVEVKLQRNALSVLEPPTGNEDDDHDFYNSSSSSDIGEKDHDFTSMDFHKLSKPRVRPTKPWAPSASKLASRGCYKELQSTIHVPHTRVNFSKLGANSLWRYCKRFHLGSMNPSTSKEQLVNIVQRHFASQLHVDELQVIVEFIHAAKRVKKTDRNRDTTVAFPHTYEVASPALQVLSWAEPFAWSRSSASQSTFLEKEGEIRKWERLIRGGGGMVESIDNGSDATDGSKSRKGRGWETIERRAKKLRRKSE